jgi:Zn-dependent M28 family amino/carboxypeptidase
MRGRGTNPAMKRTLWAVLVLAPTWWSCAGSPDAVVLETCGNARPAALAACIEQRLYVEDLSFVAQERLPGSNHWQLVQTYVHNRLEALGYTVELHQDDGAVNIIGKRTGALNPKEEVMVSAHYDHIQGCAGADDNGSGVAAALEIARVLASADFDRTTTVAFWDLEEVGLVGSAAYARRARWRGEKIIMNYVLETMGFASDEPGSQKIPTGFDVVYPRQVAQVEANENRGDFLTMVADPSANPAVALLETFAQAVDLPAITLRTAQVSLPFTKDLRRSDHQSFWNMGYPAMMLTDGANFRNPGYHCLERADTVDTLNHPFSVKIARAVAFAAATQAGMPGLQR